MVDKSKAQKDQISSGEASSFVSFVSALDGWLDEVATIHSVDDEVVLKQVKVSYQSNLLKKIEFHLGMEKAELARNNSREAIHHELIVKMYRLLIGLPSEAHDIIMENNALLKGNRLLITQLNEKLVGMKGTS